MKLQGNLHGFEFISSREIPELRGVLHEAVYKKNGAKLLFIDREDANKSFAIAFKTIPEDDTGVFHILEHSVLCGSDKYPVKEPFVELLKGSLKTFLNAFTFPDKTMYPVSSKNDKDFLNLVDIYMDAVLHPLAVKKPEIFYQEGWHYELHGKEDEMIYKGVVFNEMKGAYSSADEVEMSEMSSMLYRDNCYGKDSGGNPKYIPTLTYEKFVAAHSKYYHPSNARIILDGSVDIEKTLALLDGFLSEYDYLEIDTDITPIEHKGHVEKTIEYEISPTEDPEGKARVCLGFLTSSFKERRLSVALSIATDAIAGTNDSPFKKAMLDSGLCEDVYFVPYDGVQDNSVMIEIKNVKRENMEEVKRLAIETISEIVKTGIDKAILNASFNSLEFRVREQDMATFPAGIAYSISALDTWLYGADPKDGLSFEDDIAYLRSMLESDFYEKILEKYILNSTHSATLYMIPSATLGEKREAEEREKLSAAKAKMSESELSEIINNTELLENWQKTPDSPEALATIPMVEIADISELPEKYDSEESVCCGVESVFTKTNSRGIVYTTLVFDLSDFDERELFALSILTELYKNVATDSHSASELQTKIKTELGGFSTGTLVSSKNGLTTPYLQVAVSALASKLDSVVDIVGEVLLTSKFDDYDAIGKIIRQMKMGAQESVSAAGHSAAFLRASAYVSREAVINEHLEGIENYLKLKALDADYTTHAKALSGFLMELVGKIFTRKRLSVYYSGEKAEGYAEKLASIFPEGVDFERGSNIEPLGVRREGILIPAAISFASMAGDVLSYAEKMSGSFAVARSIASYEFLWNAIRVQGGAYGAGFIKRQNGMVGFYTYRDPNANRSVDIFKQTPEFLREFASEADNIDNFIIGAIGDSETLLTPKVVGALAIAARLRGETYEDKVRQRREILNTSGDDLLKVADILEQIVNVSGSCIIGGKAQLNAAKDKIDSIIEI